MTARPVITVPQLMALGRLCNGHVMIGTLGQHVHRANHRVFSIDGDFLEQRTATSLISRGYVKATLEDGARIEFQATELGRAAYHEHSLNEARR